MRTLRDAYDAVRSLFLEKYLPLRYKNVRIGKRFRLTNSVVNYRGGELTIGKGFFMNRNGSINCHHRITIGDYCLIGESVHIYDHNHVFDRTDQPIALQGFREKAVTIGNNCWIGTGVTILAGVTIGDHVVIGANCLIYHDIPANSVVKNHQSLLIEERKQ